MLRPYWIIALVAAPFLIGLSIKAWLDYTRLSRLDVATVCPVAYFWWPILVAGIALYCILWAYLLEQGKRVNARLASLSDKVSGIGHARTLWKRLPERRRQS